MVRTKKKEKISYEPEADVLRIEITRAPIDYASELGPFVIHFNKQGLPVYVEILEASKFLKASDHAFHRARAPQLVPAAFVRGNA